jgi:hypothetical protein
MLRRRTSLLVLALGIALLVMPGSVSASGSPAPSLLKPWAAVPGSATSHASEAPSVATGTVRTATGIASTSMTLIEQAEYDTSAMGRRLDGRFQNGSSSPVISPKVTVTWLDDSGAVVDAQTEDMTAIVVPNGGYALFSVLLAQPPTATHYTVSGEALPCGATPVYLATRLDSTSAWSHDLRALHYTVTNDTPYPVGTIRPEAYEFAAMPMIETDPPRPIAWPQLFVDVMDVVDAPPATLAPGQSFTMDIEGHNVQEGYVWPQTRVEALPVSPVPAQVFRFYNFRSDTHFYTGTTTERDQIVATLGGTYRYEGVAYSIDQYSAANSRPLMRFYNKRNGTHFYTADLWEASQIEETMSSIYHYDGIAYWVADASAGGTIVYRFYGVKSGTHFYTADPVERDRIINTQGKAYRFEGPAFSVVIAR